MCWWCTGEDYLRKIPGAKPYPFPDAYALLDYRCHVPGGRIGFDYPPTVQKCLEIFAQSTPDSLVQKYGLLELKDAGMLHTRAADMLERGFEWTLEFGEPRNPPPLRYGWGAPCCEIRLIEEGAECTDPNYEANLCRPDGNPVTGETTLKSRP